MKLKCSGRLEIENRNYIVDHIPGVKVIATGSSSFNLAQNVGEPLTGNPFNLRDDTGKYGKIILSPNFKSIVSINLCRQYSISGEHMTKKRLILSMITMEN